MTPMAAAAAARGSGGRSTVGVATDSGARRASGETRASAIRA